MRINIRKVILTACIAAVFWPAATTYAQEENSVAELSAVRHAQTVYAKTNREKSTYRSVSRQVLGASTEGAAVFGLYRGNELRKIDVTWYGETGKTAEEYYFERGQLIFVYQNNQHYDQPFGRVMRTDENRYYFEAGRLVRWVDSEKQRISPKSADYRDTQQDIIEVRLPILLGALAGTEKTYEVPLQRRGKSNG